MEDEREKLKREIKDLNEDVINSLVAERDEISQRKFEYQDKLKESNNTIRNLEDERKRLKKEIKELNEDVINNLIIIINEFWHMGKATQIDSNHQQDGRRKYPAKR